MGLRWEKLLEFTKGEVREESREIARLKRKSSLGEADIEEVLELAELYLRKRNSQGAELCLRDVVSNEHADEDEILEACNMFERMGKYDLALEGSRGKRALDRAEQVQRAGEDQQDRYDERETVPQRETEQAPVESNHRLDQGCRPGGLSAEHDRRDHRHDCQGHEQRGHDDDADRQTDVHQVQLHIPRTPFDQSSF